MCRRWHQTRLRRQKVFNGNKLRLSISHRHELATIVQRIGVGDMTPYDLKVVFACVILLSLRNYHHDPMQHMGLCVNRWPMFPLVIRRIIVFHLFRTSRKAEILLISYCLGWGHYKLVCAVCLTMYLIIFMFVWFNMCGSNKHNNKGDVNNELYFKYYTDIHMMKFNFQLRWAD